MTSRVMLLSLVLCGASAAACHNATSPSKDSVQGSWTGTLSQPNGPVQKNFTYEMKLTQSGSNVSGTAHIGIPNDASSYADFSVTGTMSPPTFQFEETAITKQTLPPSGGGWCLKSGTLQLTPSPRALSGSWTSPSCAPGTIELH